MPFLFGESLDRTLTLRIMAFSRSTVAPDTVRKSRSSRRLQTRPVLVAVAIERHAKEKGRREIFSRRPLHGVRGASLSVVATTVRPIRFDARRFCAAH